MPRRVLRFVVPLLLVVAVCVPMPARSAVGTAVVTGDALVECPGWWPSGDCSGFELHYLSRITFDAQANSTNIVGFAYVPGVGETVCAGYGPGSCGGVGTGPDTFAFADGNANLYGAGLCSAIVRAATCQAPDTDIYNVLPANAVPSLPVAVILRGENDQFLSTIPPGVQEFAFFIDTGWGNDVVVLNDNSGHAYGGADQIFCGPGQDRVITNTDVTVASDCENVTRLT